MSKTLGDVCAEAYTNCHPMQDRWQAAAEAVAVEVCDPKVYEMARLLIGKWNSNRKHHAVIEAARTWAKPFLPHSVHYLEDFTEAEYDLLEKVRALDSEEA